MPEDSTVITLRGSTDIVKEFFEYSVNTILYQRGIYPPESFKRVSKYGLAMMVTTDDALIEYISNIMNQLQDWLVNGAVQKLILVIKGVESNEVLERWGFDCEMDKENISALSSGSGTQKAKATKEISQEIQAIIRQITASISFLPLLNEACCFDLLVYADREATVPVMWEDSDPCHIQKSDEVRLRSFSTKIHKIDAMVSYKTEEDDV